MGVTPHRSLGFGKCILSRTPPYSITQNGVAAPNVPGSAWPSLTLTHSP